MILPTWLMFTTSNQDKSISAMPVDRKGMTLILLSCSDSVVMMDVVCFLLTVGTEESRDWRN